MTNKIRGEVEAKIQGETYRLVLTLGAVAEIEGAFDMPLARVAIRMGEGFRVNDAMVVLSAMSKAGGREIPIETMREWSLDALGEISSAVTDALNSQFSEGNAEAGAQSATPAKTPHPGLNGSGSGLAA